MILKIYEKDDIKNINYLEIDDYLLNHDSESVYEDHSIFILHYPSGRETKVSYGFGVDKLDEYNIIHKCQTSTGSSGSSILNLSTNKIIGIHKSYAIKNHKESYNLGTLLKYPLIDMNKNNSKNVICAKISTKLMSDNKRLNNKRSKNHIKLQTSQISNIDNEIKEKLDKKPRGSITERKYNHEHLNTDINQNYYSNESKNEKINNHPVYKITNKNKIDLNKSNILIKKTKVNNSFVIKNNNQLKEKEEFNEEDITNLNNNNEIKKKKTISLLKNKDINMQNNNIDKINYYNPCINNNNVKKNYLNNGRKIIENKIFQNKVNPQKILVNNINNTFQSKEVFQLDSAKKDQNKDIDIKQAPSTPNIKIRKNIFHLKAN